MLSRKNAAAAAAAEPVVYHHVAVQYETLHHSETRTCEDIVVISVLGCGDDSIELALDKRHHGGHVFDLCLRPESQAIVTRVELVYATNDLGVPMEFFLDLDFVIPSPPLVGDINAHPDKTGQVRFVVPSSANGLVPEMDRLLYEPNFLNARFDFLSWAGQEEVVFNARSTTAGSSCPVDANLYTLGDPVVAFLMKNIQHFPDLDLRRDVTAPRGGTGNLVVLSDRALKAIREFFTHTVYDMLRYKKSNSCLLSWSPLHRKPLDTEELEQQTRLSTPSEQAHHRHRNDGLAAVVLRFRIQYTVIEKATDSHRKRFHPISKPLVL